VRCVLIFGPKLEGDDERHADNAFMVDFGRRA
jgi:hypothetical protein